MSPPPGTPSPGPPPPPPSPRPAQTPGNRPGHPRGPVNHVLPAWDLLTGAYAAFALLAAERNRRETGRGEEVRVPLSDVAISSLGNLGQIGEGVTGQADHAR